MNNDEMLNRAKELAARIINEESGAKQDNGNPYYVTPSDMYVVWFAKTLQNWKALVSTGKINTPAYVGDYVEVTHNGDKGETYCDLYKKQRNERYVD